MEQGLTYEEYLAQYPRLVRTNVGTSMLPLLRQGRDLFIVEKRGPGRLRAGDVVLYRRPPDQYVLHRIVQVRPRDYVILGDNCVRREYGIPDSRILGVMTGFVRNGREHTVTEPGYRLYAWCMVHGAPLRILVKRAVLSIQAVHRKIFGKKTA